MENDNFTIIQIDDYLVSSEILTEYFACDYPRCKGVCCIIGDSGAPLEECECEAIEREYAAFSPYMTEAEKEVVRREGFFSIDQDGDIVTPLIRDGEECVYTCFDEDENCFCAIEKSYFEGRCRFRKPISCWLYPIRVTHLSSGYTALNLHRWDICKDAFIKGRKDGTYVYQFLKEPIVRFFGEDFYEALDAASISLRASS